VTLPALSFWRPWPYVILHEDPEIRKDFENRTWTPPDRYLGKLFALHATKMYDGEGKEFIERTIGHLIPNYQPSMAVVGTFRLIGWFRYEDGLVKNVKLAEGFTLGVLEHGEKWIVGPVVWILSEQRKLETPVPCRGSQGIWHLPEDVDKLVRDQL
jgi:hypothetical protein